MKLNPKKCTFGMREGTFLGYKVNADGLQILSNLEVTGRLLKWSFELEEHDIHYRLRTSVKGQILADFIVERPKDDPSDTPMEEEEELLDPWILFDATNNEAEYEALMVDLRIAEQIAVVEEEGRTWMTQIHEYLTEEILPEEKRKARAIRRKAGRYVVTNEILYKKSFLGPWLRCVGPLQANYVLREIHEGSCSMHAGPGSVVAKALRSGYYWPTMHADAGKLIRECNSFQWGIDIAGPFSEGPGKVKFLIVAIDYFTKWIEAKHVATITVAQIKKLDNPFKYWCEKLCIRQCFASVKHLQANSLVERANKSLGVGIKARLDERNKNWMEEISHVLRAHRTMIKSSNRETPSSFRYGTEAVIPVEIGMPTLRTTEVDMIKNDEALEINLDLLEERREHAAIQEAKSKAKMEKYYNARVRNTSFKLGDLVYRNNEASHAEDGGKLGPKWEGPYEVTEALGKGAYKLRDRNENILPRTWNVCNLKKCYVHEM
ncbi:reverse transcriptase domain-containing protein [Tanacetum coccineum]